MNVYFISGVGADRRVFRNVNLPAYFNIIHLDWIKPHKRESLVSYAHRLAAAIDKSKPFLLVGLSFGGMLANEIDKVYPAQKVVLISSVPSANQLPFYYKWAGWLQLQNLVPITLLKSASLMKRLFTAESKDEKAFLRQAIREADPAFIRWSLGAIVQWKTTSPPKNYIHIHGSGDLILPLRFAGCTHRIRKAGHLMVITCGKEISEIISNEIRPLAQHTGNT